MNTFVKLENKAPQTGQETSFKELFLTNLLVLKINLLLLNSLILVGF